VARKPLFQKTGKKFCKKNPSAKKTEIKQQKRFKKTYHFFFLII